MSDSEEFQVVENFKLTPTGKIVIQAFTGSGLVASIASHHLIDKWKMTEKAYVSSPLIPSVGIVRDGVIQRPIRVFENHSYVLVLSEIGIPQEKLVKFMQKLFDWYVSVDPASIVIIGALPTGRPANATDLRYSIVAGDKMTQEFLADKGVWTMPQGAVYGSVALSLMEAKRSGIASYAILSHCIATIPDYLAAKKVIELLQVTLDTIIPLEPLESNALELKEHLLHKNSTHEGDESFDIEDFELYDDEFDEYEEYDEYDDDDDEDDDDLSAFI